jgi:hypothetical protein
MPCKLGCFELKVSVCESLCVFKAGLKVLYDSIMK